MNLLSLNGVKMKKLDRLLAQAKQENEPRLYRELRQIMHKLSMEQLQEIAQEEAPEERVKDILSSVGAAHLLERV